MARQKIRGTSISYTDYDTEISGANGGCGGRIDRGV